MVVILDFRLDQFYVFLIYKSPWCFLPSFKSIGLPFQKKKKQKKKIFKLAAILDFPSKQFSLFFLTTSHPYASYQISGQLAFWFWRRSKKMDFQDDCHGLHLRFPIRTILAIVYSQVTQMLPIKFQVTLPSSSGEEAKIDFQDSSNGHHLEFPIRMILAVFH